MDNKTFKLEIITPLEEVFQGDVKRVRIPGDYGSLGIMAGHAPLVTSLSIGEIKIDMDNETKYFATSGGTIEVLPHKTIVLVETAEDAHLIDIRRAIYAKERAQERLKQNASSTDIERAKDALSKAQNRLKVSKKVKSRNE